MSEWYLLPAVHGPQLRHASKDAPSKFIEPKQLGELLLGPAFNDMKIKAGHQDHGPQAGLYQVPNRARYR